MKEYSDMLSERYSLLDSIIMDDPDIGVDGAKKLLLCAVTVVGVIVFA
jgi:hypothetical protein